MSSRFKLPLQLLRNPRQSLSVGWRAYQDYLLNLYRNPSLFVNSRRTIGTNVFECDWDLLIVLDTCRPDALREVKSEYEFLDNISSYWSVGGQSAEWMVKTFDVKYQNIISETAYITGNPHSKSVFKNRLQHWKSSTGTQIDRVRKFGDWDYVEPTDFAHYEELWQYADESYDQCQPRRVTDRAISVSREQKPDKMVLHYMPPHLPYEDDVIPADSPIREYEGSAFSYLVETGDKKSVFEAYLSMLRWSLDDIELLLKNVNFDTVAITADHGEAFGEFGIYRHQAGSLHPHIRRVPWATTTASDTNSYSPNFSGTEDEVQSIEDSLKALGYL